MNAMAAKRIWGRHRLNFLTCARFLAVSLALAGCAGESGQNENDSTIQNSQHHLVGAALVTINAGGYLGNVCVIPLGCTAGGGSRAFDLAAGTYPLTTPNSLALNILDNAIGTMTVAANGAVSLDSAAQLSMNPPITSGTNTTINAKIVTLTLDKNGYAGGLSITGVNGFDALNISRMLCGRRYRMHIPNAFHPTRPDSSFSQTSDLRIDALCISALEGEAAQSFEITGNSLRMLTAPVRLNRNGSICSLSFTGIAGFDANNLARLVVSRRYRLHTPYALSIERGDSNFSVNPDLFVRSDSTIEILGSESQRHFVDPTAIVDNTLIMKNSTVILDRDGYPGGISVVGLATFNPTGQGFLVGRRYQFGGGLAGDPTRSDAMFSAAPDFKVDYDGAISLISAGPNEGIRRSFEDPIGLTVKLKTIAIALDKSGYAGDLSLTGIANWGGSPSLKLLKQRRYRVHSSYSYDLSRNDSTFSSAHDLQVNDTSITLLSDEFKRSAMQVGATGIKFLVQPITINRSGYVGNISLPGITNFDAAGRITTLRGRRYLFSAAGSLDLTRNDTNFGSVADLGVDAFGKVFLAATLTSYLALDPVTDLLTLRTGQISVARPAGYTGNMGVSGLAASATAATVTTPVIIGRRYTMLPGNIIETFPLENTQCTPNPYVSGVNSFAVTCTDPNGVQGPLPPQPPTAPTNLTITALTGSSLRANWTDSSGGAAGFVIQRSDVPGPSYIWNTGTAIPAGTTTFTDTGLLPTHAYHYRVGSVNATFPNPALWVGPSSGTTLTVCAGQATGSSCGGNACNPMVCSELGACVAGTPLPCNDNNACTTDSCDPTFAPGFCRHTAAMVGTACDDGNLCATGDACGPNGLGGTACLPGPTAVTCDDHNACTVDTCQPTTGQCSTANAANGATCGSNTCGTGTCQAGTCEMPTACFAERPEDESAQSPQAPPLGDQFKDVLKGSLSVSPTGAAMYTVPIAIPPGIAGMAPNLSLVYNSQGGNGIAGQGWELSGLSMIHRCPRTRALHGSAGPVRLDASDSLCLDGQPLVQKAGGAYYLESDPFSTVITVVDTDTQLSPGHIRGFRIVTKTGESRIYGAENEHDCPPGPSDCRDRARVKYVDPSGNDNSLIWLLSRVVDSWGNHFDIHYNKDRGHEVGVEGFLGGGIKVTSIAYTGTLGALHEGEGSVEPFVRVDFGYETQQRQDIRWMRFGPVSIPKTHRLANIKIVSLDGGETTLGTYNLSYLPNDPTHMLPSRLQQIKYCAADGDAEPCLQPLIFGWQGGGYDWRLADEYKIPERLDGRSQFADLDGDGLIDFIRNDGAILRNSFGFHVTWDLPENLRLVKTDGRPESFLADMNNDGLPDLVTSPGGAAQPPRFWLNHLGTDGTWEESSIPTPPAVAPLFGTIDFSKPNEYAVHDMNGDGRADVVRFDDEHDSIDVFWNKSDGWQNSRLAQPPIYYNLTHTVNGTPFGTNRTCALKDVNRDGLPDAVCGSTIAINGGKPGPDGSAWVITPPSSAGGLEPVEKTARIFGDIDGDAFHDAVTVSDYVQHFVPEDGSVACPGMHEPLPRAVHMNVGFGYIAPPSILYLDVLNQLLPPPTLAELPSVPDAPQQPPCMNLEYIGNHALAMGDFNADGLADMVLSRADAEEFPGQLLVNTGTTWATSNLKRVPLVMSNYPNLPTNGVYIDLDGDGVTDVLKSDATGNPVTSKAWINTFERPAIDTFPNGLARDNIVGYATITSDGARSATDVGMATYEDDDQLVPGTTYFMAPLSVVSVVEGEDGRGQGTTSKKHYTYRALRASSTGRGPQGFREQVVFEEVSNLKVTTTYAQAHPYTGQTTSVSKKIGEYDLSFTTTKYCDRLTEVISQCTPDTGPPQGAAYINPDGPRFVYPKLIDDVTFLWSTLPTTTRQVARTETEFVYDQYGNPTRTTVKMISGASSETHTKTTRNKYGEEGDVLLARRGRVTEMTVTSESNQPGIGGTPPRTITQTTKFEYDASISRPFSSLPLPLSKKIIEPAAQPPMRHETAYAYDYRGNVTTTTECQAQFNACLPGAVDAPTATDPAFRTSLVSYNPADSNAPPGSGLPNALSYTQRGRFPVKMTRRRAGASDYVEFVAYNPIHGGVVEKTAIDGVRTCYDYDAFGRQTVETQRCRSSSPLVTDTQQYFAPGGSGAKMVTAVTSPGGSVTWTYVDVLGRAVKTISRGFAGELIETGTKTFDRVGRVETEAKPHVVGQSSSIMMTDYDDLGRIEFTSHDLGVIDGRGGSASDVVTYGYAGTTVTTIRTVGGQTQTRSETKNVAGQVAVVSDAHGAVTNFFYDTEGRLTDKDGPGGIVSTVYDDRGRKTSSSDPDMGDWSYEYNGFGDLISQTDAANQRTSMSYDDLGRLRSKTNGTRTAHWIYDVPDVAPGKLAAMIGPPDDVLAAGCNSPYLTLAESNRAIRSFKYTPLGQVDEVVECVDGTTFRSNYGYDAAARQAVVTYPEVGGSRLAVRHHYTSTGYLHFVSDDTASGPVYWAAKAMNALGQVTEEVTRNGVRTVAMRNASTGWLMDATTTSQANGNQILQHWAYTFDEAGNLRTRSRSGDVVTSSSTETLGYDRLNRLTSSRVEVPSLNYNVVEPFDYDLTGNLRRKGDTYYQYDNCDAGPHAVCSAGASTFAYDENGNMFSGGGRTVSYNVQNKPTRFTQGGTTVDFGYGADGHRVVQAVAGATPARTRYAGLGETGKSLYEQTTRGNVVEHVQFLYAGTTHAGNAFALRVTTTDGSGGAPVSAMKYHTFDHLGSVTAISNAQGRAAGAVAGDYTNAEVLGYDPWGARRSPTGQASTAPGSFKSHPGRREFTGHERISGVDLVNMNGRVYDASLGRFLSPDPNVQFVTDLQSYNRYSYVQNNPLRYTDPTGYFLSGPNLFKIGYGLAIAGVGAACVATGGTGCVGYAIIGAYFSTSVALMEGASFKSVVISTAIGYAAGQLGGAAVNGLGGGMLAQIVGGAMSGAIAATASTPFSGGNYGRNLLTGAMMGALSAAVSAGVTAGVSQATATSQGGNLVGGRGAARGSSALSVDEATLAAHAKGTATEGRVTIDKDLRTLGYTDRYGRVRISPRAFESEALLDITLEHEGVHVRQVFEGNLAEGWNHEGRAVNELQAFEKTLRSVAAHSDDSAVMRHAGDWAKEFNTHMERLQGTEYFQRVNGSSPNYQLLSGICPRSVCFPR